MVYLLFYFAYIFAYFIVFIFFYIILHTYIQYIGFFFSFLFLVVESTVKKKRAAVPQTSQVLLGFSSLPWFLPMTFYILPILINPVNTLDISCRIHIIASKSLSLSLHIYIYINFSLYYVYYHTYKPQLLSHIRLHNLLVTRQKFFSSSCATWPHDFGQLPRLCRLSSGECSPPHDILSCIYVYLGCTCTCTSTRPITLNSKRCLWHHSIFLSLAILIYSISIVWDRISSFTDNANWIQILLYSVLCIHEYRTCICMYRKLSASSRPGRLACNISFHIVSIHIFYLERTRSLISYDSCGNVCLVPKHAMVWPNGYHYYVIRPIHPIIAIWMYAQKTEQPILSFGEKAPIPILDLLRERLMTAKI